MPPDVKMTSETIPFLSLVSEADSASGCKLAPPPHEEGGGGGGGGGGAEGSGLLDL